MNDLSKKERLLWYRQQRNLPKYDLAVKSTSSGYQPFDYTKPETSLTQGYDVSQDTNALKQSAPLSIASDAITKATLPNSLAKIGSNVFYNQSFKELSKQAATEAAKTGSQAALRESLNQVTVVGGNIVAKEGAQEAIKAAQQQAASKALSSSAATAVARGANIAAAAYGIYDTTKGIINMTNNVRSTGDMMDTASRQTSYRNGVAYERLGGISAGDEMKYASTQNTVDTVKNTVGGALAGGAVAGAIAGSVVPGIGTAIGAGVGALTSLVGSIFAGKARKRKVQERLDRTATAIENQNRQNESLAASQGLREQFYQNRYSGNGMINANRGFNPSQVNNNGSGVFKEVWTPEGKQYDEQGSWVGKGESLLDYNTGKAAVVKQGKVGVDNQPASAKEGDSITIAGNDKNWITGNTFAKEVAPYTEVIEQINKKEDAVKNSNASQKTKEINMLNLMRAKMPYLAAAKKLTDQQQLQHQLEGMYGYPGYKCGKPGYDVGKWGELALQYGPYVLNWLTANNRYNMYKNATPTANNSYQVNPYSQRALNALSQMYYDPTPELNAARDAYRQQLYVNNNAGSLSAGQRAALNNALGIGLIKNRTSILQNAQKQMNEYRKAWATSALTAGEQEASRKQSAYGSYYDQLATSAAAKLKGMESAENAKMQVLNTFAKQLFDESQYRNTLNMYEKIQKLYDA